MSVRDLEYDFSRVLPVGSNSTQSGSYSLPAPTTTDPVGTGVIAVAPQTGAPWPNLLLVPFGIGANATTFKMCVGGWRTVPGGASGPLFIWVPLCQFLCTISTGAACTGVAGTNLLNTENTCDTISLTGGTAGTDVTVISPANFTTALTGATASIICDWKAYRYLQPVFDRAGSATSANCLYAIL